MSSRERAGEVTRSLFRGGTLHWLIVVLLLGVANLAPTPASAAPAPRGLAPSITAPKKPLEIPRVLTRPLPTELETDRFDVVDVQWRFDGPVAAAPAHIVVYPPAYAAVRLRRVARVGAHWIPRLFDPRGPPGRA